MSLATYDDELGRWRFDWAALLRQTEVWIDRNGREHRIESMDASYREAAANWLATQVIPRQRRMGRVKAAVVGAILDSPLGPRGEVATDAAWDEHARWCELAALEPEDCPLYRELVK